MKYKTAYTVSEWEWFQIQAYLIFSGTVYSQSHYWVRPDNYGIVKKEPPIKLYFHHANINIIESKEFSRAEREKKYGYMINELKRIMQRIIDGLPNLKEEFSFDEYVEFQIMGSDNHSSYPICSFFHGECIWQR